MLNLVEELVRQTPPDEYKRGVDAKFKRIDSRWGFKFYRYKSDCDKTYSLQEFAYQHGLAPELGDKFDLKTPQKNRVYGYITECVTKTGNEMYTEKHGYPSLFLAMEFDMEEFPEYRGLIRNLERIIYLSDMHGGNVGLMDDGRLVGIDFGECSRKS